MRDRVAVHAAVCTMALMEMARITPLLSALPRLLVEDGRFVFSVTHPVFNSGDARIVGERVRRGSAFVTEVSIIVRDYLRLDEALAIVHPDHPWRARL